MKNLFTIFLVSILLILPQKASGFGGQRTTLQIRVLDELGNPMPNVKVKIGFTKNSSDSHGRNKSKSFTGTTDTEGCYKKTSISIGHVGYIVEKEGYYRSFADHDFPRIKDSDGKWKKWNASFDVVLRKKVNPIPMYAKRVRLHYPFTEKAIGFDMEKGDLVAPYGKGITNDVYLQVSGYRKERFDRHSELIISFANPGDGIQEIEGKEFPHSQFKFLREAPETGYKGEIFFSRTVKRGNSSQVGIKDNQFFVFRVRTIMDEKGNVIKANYGKIRGSINSDFLDENTVSVLFEYYFNPDFTRNLEFDPSKNLIKDAEIYEKPDKP